MKKYLAFLIILFPIFSYCQAAQGDSLYSQGNFAGALTAYQTELAAAPNNAYLYYNIGNCYYKMGDLGYAIAYYSKAFDLNPRSSLVRENLEMALTRSGAVLVPHGVPEVLHRAFYILSKAEVRGLCMIFVWCFGISAALYIWKGKGKKVMMATGVILVLTALWLGAISYAGSDIDAVVKVSKMTLRSGPGEKFETTATLPEGYYLTIEDKKDDWYLVREYRDANLKGWTKKSSFIIIEEI
ncbi:tetratricopeptide (TPR) repeat protein [Elusimicrobium simillimum]|uniref:tetratricopeptide repeat protein n=1 Tax=Elusimicrobium simillimum TaxID=3143438 RepID=UPI003C6F40CF